jgi:hypothetical protein
MFSKHHMFKLVVGIAVVASLAFAGAHRAMATRPFITDTLGGRGHPVTATQNLSAARVHGFTIITDTLGGNGTPKLLTPRAAKTPVVTPAAQMVLHFQHEDALYQSSGK